MTSDKDNTTTAFLKIKEEKYRSYTFGSLLPLDRVTLDLFVTIFKETADEKPARLEGRAAPRFVSIPETGPLVIKFYKRGGWISRLNREKYLRTFKTRSRKEFEFLIAAAKAGVRVPTPVAFASQGHLLYQAWLMTEQITSPVSFVQLCLHQEEKAVSLIPEISRNITLLIDCGIHHVDLHPGNIIVDKDDRPYIIDFDKARYCGSGLREKYQRRWARAIRKHNLPQALTDLPLTASNPDIS